MLQTLYFRYGMRWKSRYSPVFFLAKAGVVLTLLAGVGYVPVAYSEYENQDLMQKVAFQEQQKHEISTMLRDCMSGVAIFMKPGGKGGFKQIAQKCKGVEEIPV